MNGWLYLLLFLALGYFVLVNALLVLSVRRMSDPEALIKPVAANSDSDALNDGPFSAWAEAQGFRRDSRFDFFGIPGSDKPMEVDAWVSSDKLTILLRYRFNGREWLDIASGLDDHYSLVTSNFHNALILPQPPNVLIQVFVDMPPEQLHQEHLKARTYVEQHFGATPDRVDVPVTRLVAEALRKQMTYIRSLPFWYLRGPGWQLFRGRRYRNRSIIELIESLPGGNQ
jgi:hypothetical protein